MRCSPQYIFTTVFILLLLHASTILFATDYYNIKNGNAADLNTWNSSRDGKGSAPKNFTDLNDNFIVQPGSIITATSGFSCAGSLILEKGSTYTNGANGNITAIASVVTINEGATFQLSPNTILIAGFILVQGTLENKGGEIRFNNASPVSAITRRPQF